MQSASRQDDRQAALLISVVVGVVVAVVTTATFYWIYELASGKERREAAVLANAPWDAAIGTQNITGVPANVTTDGRPAWLGEKAWTEGVQAGQAWVQQFPNPLGVQVLVGMTSAEIWGYMVQHVSGALGVSCQYCHVINGPNDYNFAAETYPQKQAARSMMRLVNDANAQFIVDLPNWKGNYVQCATCHQGVPKDMDTVGRKFFQSVAPIETNTYWLGPDGKPVESNAEKPEELRGRVPLKQAIMASFYNYEVWLPFDAAVPETGRGSLALTYDDGPTQEKVNINQNAMNYQAWSLGVGCVFCHNSRNFIDYELGTASGITDPQYGYNKLKAQQMMLMTTWMAQNWDKYGAIAKTDVELKGPAGFVDGMYYRKLNDQVYTVPGCYTCHGGRSIPRGAVNEASIPEGSAGNQVLPPALRGNQ